MMPRSRYLMVRWQVLAVVPMVFFLVGAKGCGHCTTNDLFVDESFCIKKVVFEGALEKPSGATARDETGTAAIGPWVLWTYGDTLGHRATGTPFASNSASLSTVDQYIQQIHTVDSSGYPHTLIPHDAYDQLWEDCMVPNPPDTCAYVPPARCTNGQCEFHEAVFGGQTACANDDQCRVRVAHWSGKPVEESSNYCDPMTPYCEGKARIVFNSYFIRSCYLCYTWFGTGSASLLLSASMTSTIAEREPGYLFTAADEDPSHNVLLEKDGYAYFTASKAGLMKFGRVAVGNLKEPSWYRYWGGSYWVSSWDAAEVADPAFGRGGSVSWNPFVNRFLSISSNFFTGEMEIQAAPNVYGPWSPLVAVPLPDGRSGRQPLLHPELDTGGGKQTRFTYFESTDNIFVAENPVVKLVLNHRPHN